MSVPDSCVYKNVWWGSSLTVFSPSFYNLMFCPNMLFTHILLFRLLFLKKFDLRLKSCVLWHCHCVCSSDNLKGTCYLYLHRTAVQESWENLADSTTTHTSKTESLAALQWQNQISHNVHILQNKNLLCNIPPMDLYSGIYESLWLLW